MKLFTGQPIPPMPANFSRRIRHRDCRKLIKTFVQPRCNRAIRAEAGAYTGASGYVKDGIFGWKESPIGACVCCTCGEVKNWCSDKQSGVAGLESGHFLKKPNSLRFEETNIHPQCVQCNKYLNGNDGNYAIFMDNVFGQEEVDRLKELKNTSRHFEWDELLLLRWNYEQRIKAAIEIMGPNA